MNVKEILIRCRIRFVEGGKNTRRGCVSIKCPVCGIGDPSEHGNVNLRSGFFSCWRNRAHAMNFRRLITLIAGAEAAEDIGENEGPPPEGYDAAVAAMLSGSRPAAQPEVKVIAWPAEARPIRDNEATGRYWDYLLDRHVPQYDIRRVCDTYDLRCCLYGEHTCRILFPVHDWNNMIGFTGRAIGQAHLRYKAYPRGPQVKWGLFGLPQAKQGGRRLIINEGPFDSLNLNIYAPRDCHAVAIMTTSITPQQQVLIDRLARLFDDVVIMLDQGAEAQAMQLAGQLMCGHRTALVPNHRKDPGEMTAREVDQIWND